MINKRQKVSIENTRFIFTTNFSGDPSRDRFGSNKRRVNLVLTEDMAHHLMDMGVTVKQTRPNPEKTYDEPFLPDLFRSGQCQHGVQVASARLLGDHHRQEAAL